MTDQEFFQKCDNLERRIKQLEAVVGKIEAESEPEFERVEYGEKYYHVNIISEPCINELTATSGYDEIRYENNNYFRTKERAQEVLDKIKFLLKLERLHDIYCPNYKPDWNGNSFSLKHYVRYNTSEVKWYPHDARTIEDTSQVYFPTAEIAQKVCDVLNKELK